MVPGTYGGEDEFHGILGIEFALERGAARLIHANETGEEENMLSGQRAFRYQYILYSMR